MRRRWKQLERAWRKRQVLCWLVAAASAAPASEDAASAKHWANGCRSVASSRSASFGTCLNVPQLVVLVLLSWPVQEDT